MLLFGIIMFETLRKEYGANKQHTAWLLQYRIKPASNHTLRLLMFGSVRSILLLAFIFVSPCHYFSRLLFYGYYLNIYVALFFVSLLNYINIRKKMIEHYLNYTKLISLNLPLHFS